MGFIPLFFAILKLFIDGASSSGMFLSGLIMVTRNRHVLSRCSISSLLNGNWLPSLLSPRDLTDTLHGHLYSLALPPWLTSILYGRILRLYMDGLTLRMFSYILTNQTNTQLTFFGASLCFFVLIASYIPVFVVSQTPTTVPLPAWFSTYLSISTVQHYNWTNPNDFNHVVILMTESIQDHLSKFYVIQFLHADAHFQILPVDAA